MKSDKTRTIIRWIIGIFFTALIISIPLKSHAALPGDCDSNGTVTIAEVQSAINMFLGLNAPLLCVDEDSSKSVSISEVQKTINSFLGLTHAINNPAIYSQSASTKVQVSANGVVNDPTSGMTFAFPKGGTGTITTAKATTVLEPPYPGGTGLQFTYSASEAVSLRIADNIQTNTSMFVWGNFDSKGSKWYPASPRTQSNGFLYFDLYMPASSPKLTLKGVAAKTVNATVANSTLEIYVVQTPKSAQQQNIKDSISAAQNAALNAMDSNLASKTRASIASNPLNYVWQTKPECYYDAFEPWLIYWRQPNPAMVIQDAAVMLTNDVPSHEIAHYLTHMIFGNTTYMSLVDAGPPENPAHAIGLWYDQQNIRSVSLLEDYAYYLQFVEIGYVQMKALNPKIVANNFFKYYPPTLASDYNGPVRSYDPKVVDIPSLEGFATVLMAYCTHTDPDNITDFKGNKTPCPAVGASPGGLLNVYQDGNIYIGGLLNSLRTFVENKGYKDAMTVIAERVGWSYHGDGKVLYSGTTTPVPGVEVINVITVNGKEYEASRGTSNAFGTYKLDRVFPGISQLKYLSAGVMKTENITIRDDQATTQFIGLNVVMMPPAMITSISPTTGVVGTAVAITGTGFGATQGSGSVTFNGKSALITTWSDTRITTTVPTAATTGNVVVTVNSVGSNTIPFTVTSNTIKTIDFALQVNWDSCYPRGSITTPRVTIPVGATGNFTFSYSLPMNGYAPEDVKITGSGNSLTGELSGSWTYCPTSYSTSAPCDSGSFTVTAGKSTVNAQSALPADFLFYGSPACNKPTVNYIGYSVRSI